MFFIHLRHEAQITDVLSGAWKNVKLKAYNFKSKGALTTSGALHPRMRFFISIDINIYNQANFEVA